MQKKIDITGPNGTFTGCIKVDGMEVEGFAGNLLIIKKSTKDNHSKLLEYVEEAEDKVRKHLKVQAFAENTATDFEKELVKRGYARS